MVKPRTLLRRFVVLGVVALGLGTLCLQRVTAAAGGVTAGDLLVTVDPRGLVRQVVIPDEQVLASSSPAGAQLVDHSSALHGTVERLPGGDFQYTPTADFWTLGSDRFHFTVEDPATGAQAVGQVRLVGLTAGVFASQAGFVGEDALPPWDLAQYVGRGIGGDQAVRMVGESPAGTAHIVLSTPLSGVGSRGLTQGGKVVGGGGSPPPQPPPPPPPPSAQLAPLGALTAGRAFEDYYDFPLIAAEGAAGAPVHVELRPTDTGDAIRLNRLDASGQALPPGPWHLLGSGPHEYELEWWATEAGSGGTQLWANGRLLEFVEAPAAGLVERASLGVLSPHPVEAPGLVLDKVSLWHWGDGSGVAPRAVFRAVASFNGGTLAPLAPTGGASLNSVAPLRGAGDLQVRAEAKAPSYVSLPAATPATADDTWNARFQLRLEGLQLPEKAVIRLAEATRDGASEAAVRLELRRAPSGAFQLRLRARDDAGGWSTSGWQSVHPSGAQVELQWSAARGTTLATGLARLWVGGTLRQELRHLANSNQRVHQFHLGLLDAPEGIGGEFRLDEVQSWHLTGR